jgi:uncharacterized protein
MDAMTLGLFLFGSFIGGVTTGLAGFALALPVSGIWLHIIRWPTTSAIRTSVT